MNQRIRQLWEQATSTVSVNHEGYRGKGYTEQVEFFDKEKFAELIVAECVGVCNKQTPNWKGEYATAFGDGIEFCISGIKEHFGVE